MRELFRFKGTWRTYQQEVLKQSQEFLKDGKFHLVAAPGAGKTTLGIELLCRLDKPALVLVPTITIREQWVSRIKQSFLADEKDLEQCVSQDLQKPKVITVATYQALHQVMRRQESAASDELSLFRDLPLGTLCLDECHHLRNEWWKSLEDFRKRFASTTLLSLTATPPYDAPQTHWERYISLCGEIDQEITIPELVKEGDLCPHQDYVHFSSPNSEENEEIQTYETVLEEFLWDLWLNEEFEKAILSHKVLQGELSYDQILEYPEHLERLLVYLQAQGLPFPQALLHLQKSEQIRAFQMADLEGLLQDFLYDHVDYFSGQASYQEELKKKLARLGLLDHGRVILNQPPKVEKVLNQSISKFDSVRQIVVEEAASLGHDLRLAILTDHICKDFKEQLGNDQAPLRQLGLLPFFELLRREKASWQLDANLGVLCGSLVIIPTSARAALESILSKENVTFLSIAGLSENDFLEVVANKTAVDLTGAVTELFQQGEIEVLIGTKSLLGEGWDVPCINSLILATTVGSFMLSNQMRGRSIRIWNQDPQKTSNIWHLATIYPHKKWSFGQGKLESTQETDDQSPDILKLKRRFQHFLGLSYDGRQITTGLDRLSVIQAPFSDQHIQVMNQQSLLLAQDRERLAKEWKNALFNFPVLQPRQEIEVYEKLTSNVQLHKLQTRRNVYLLVELAIVLLALALSSFASWIPILNLALLPSLLYCQQRLHYYQSPLNQIKDLGQGLKDALAKQGYLSSESIELGLEEIDNYIQVYLKGASQRESHLFANCLEEFFSDIDNQRYIIKQESAQGTIYYAVPSIFAGKKREAQLFLTYMQSYLGKSELIYTRNEAGRKVLFQARMSKQNQDFALTKKQIRVRK